MFQTTFKSYFTAIIMAVISAAFAASAFGQVRTPARADNPHDYTDRYYAANGISTDGIQGRLTGEDFLSTFSKTTDPECSPVRVLITRPAYTPSGDLVFWSPLGQLGAFGFTLDDAGINAREIASRNPMYVFPDTRIGDPNLFQVRQSPMIDESAGDQTDLGVRLVLTVNYTGSPTGSAILKAMARRNGTALDGGPIVRTLEDLHILVNHDLVTVDFDPSSPVYLVSPVIKGVDNGAIARDAFLSIVTDGGTPLAGESMFMTRFACAQMGTPCIQVSGSGDNE